LHTIATKGDLDEEKKMKTEDEASAIDTQTRKRRHQQNALTWGMRVAYESPISRSFVWCGVCVVCVCVCVVYVVVGPSWPGATPDTVESLALSEMSRTCLSCLVLCVIGEKRTSAHEHRR
jgi:hypothetical protein